jgi:hypothetical protein
MPVLVVPSCRRAVVPSWRPRQRPWQRSQRDTEIATASGHADEPLKKSLTSLRIVDCALPID